MTALSPYVITFNCGRQPIDPPSLATHLFSALPSPQSAPDIIVLCLQELAPIAYSFLGGSYLVPYLSPIRHAVTLAAKSLDNADYVNVISRNVGMTAIMAFMLRDQTAQIIWLETAEVGVGLWEMGNKGAIGIRMGYSVGEETLDMTFVSAHLAPMEDALQRRNEDYKNIVRGLVFTSVSPTAVRKTTAQRIPQENSNDSDPLLPTSLNDESIPPMSGLYTPTSHLFLAGDLNYRTSSIKPPETAYLTWPQPTQDANALEHYSHLLAYDQLTPERKAGRTCHGLQEAAIDFPPTYKYSDKARALASLGTKGGDNGTNEPDVWLWAKHRYPSWCDRVLYLDLPSWFPPVSAASDHPANIQIHGYQALPLLPSSDHRPVACAFSIPAVPLPEPSEEQEAEAESDVRIVPPFGINPMWRERRQSARMKEVVVGLASYLALTWEGRGILLAILCGAMGGWALVKSLIEV
ncbi:hypothetical protein MMC21_004471 [Puttea exsequens]|nr:hypothetical protein [Puttea exsequens]